MSVFIRAESKTPMRVGDLIRALEWCDPTALVFTEGCDCTGDVGSVVEDQKRFFWNADGTWAQGPGVDLKRVKSADDESAIPPEETT